MFTARTISKLMDKWATEKTPTEVQITDALETIGRLHEYCLQLERKIHNQRAANRENWEIIEMRRKWLGSDSARRMYANLLKRHQALLKEQRECQKQQSI